MRDVGTHRVEVSPPLPRAPGTFVGGSYVEGKTGPLMERQMYVEFQLPAQRTRPIRSS